MPINDRPSIGQQENIVSLLAHSPQHGRIIANLIDPALFDGDYKLIASRCIDYWKEYDCPPGAHTIDLFPEIVDNIHDARRAHAFRRILVDMSVLAPRVNTEYVINDLQSFMQGQLLQDAIIRCATELQRGTSLDVVQEILAEVLRRRTLSFDRGVRLDDDLEPFLDWLETRNTEFFTGIKTLDAMGIVPARGTVLLFIAGKGRGKSWFLVNVGRHAMMLGKRVLHVSLENDEHECRLRYYMTLFAASQHHLSRNRSGVATHAVTAPLLTRPDDESKRHQVESIAGLTDADSDQAWKDTPSFSFKDERGDIDRDLRRILKAKIAELNCELIIKRFPNRSLSVDALASYLDNLEQVEGFIPDILILDYAKLLKLPGSNAQDRRIGIGDNFEKLRALAIERNMALVTADQLNRPGYAAKKASSTHIGEDWSQVHTADIVLTHSATDTELQFGLCRVWVDHARGQRDKFGLVLTQNFNIGQFCLDDGFLPEKYYETMQPGRPSSGSNDPPSE